MKMNFLRWMTVATGLVSVARGGTIAWFYALDSDKATFESVVGKPLRSVTSGQVTMHDYRIGAHRVVAAKMGSGCMNTTATVSTVLALNPADRVISTGPAGGLTGNAEPGTWLRVGEVIAWQMGRAEGGGRVVSGENATVSLSFDEKDWPDGRWKIMNGARIASGEAFIASGETRASLASDTKAIAVEMNAAGLMAGLEGRAAKILILRVISDRADETASEDFAAFCKSDSGEGGRMVAEIVKSLPVEKNQPGAHEALKELLEGR